MSGDEWHGNTSRVYGHMEYRNNENSHYLHENKKSKSGSKKHAHFRNYSMSFGQQNGEGGQFGFGGDRLFSSFDRKDFYGNRREFSKKHNYFNANGNFDKKGNINISMERSHRGMEDGNYESAGDDSLSEKESIDSGKWSYQSSKDETPTVDTERKDNWRGGYSRKPRGKGYRSARGRYKGCGIGHQEKSPLDMSLKDKTAASKLSFESNRFDKFSQKWKTAKKAGTKDDIYKFGVFLKNEIPQANAIQTIENGLAKCRLGLKSNFDVDENKTVSGKLFFKGVLKLGGLIMGQSSGFTKKETKHKAYERALYNLTQKSVDEIFQLNDPIMKAERDKEVAAVTTNNNAFMAIKDPECSQAGNSTVSQSRDEELVSADLETNRKTDVQISDGDIGQAGNDMLKNDEAASFESGGYKAHMLINADSVQTGENNTQIIHISPGQPVSIDQKGNANSVIVNINLQQERRPSIYVRGSDRYIDLKIQMSRRDGLTVVHAEDLENLGLEALKTVEGQLIIRSIETALDVETINIFKGSIIIRLKENKDSIRKLKSAIDSEQLHKILARIVELKKVRLSVLGNNVFLNVTACIPTEDLCFTEKDSICIRFKSSSEDIYSKLKTKVENGQLPRILASITEIEPVHSAFRRSDLIMNVTASVTEGNERPYTLDESTCKNQDQVKLPESCSIDYSPSSLPETSPCALCKNGMKCDHHRVESEPETKFDSSVRIKSKVESFLSTFTRSDPSMNVTAYVTEGNARPLTINDCTLKSQDQVKLMENDSSDLCTSILRHTISCTRKSIVESFTEIESMWICDSIELDLEDFRKSLRENFKRILASTDCISMNRENVKLLENENSDISPRSLLDKLSRSKLPAVIKRQWKYLLQTMIPSSFIEDHKEYVFRYIRGINICEDISMRAWHSNTNIYVDLDIVKKQHGKNKENNMCNCLLCKHMCVSRLYELVYTIEPNVSGISYVQIFLDRSSSKLRRIYLLRKRGLGETTFCTKITNDWQNAHEGREVAQCGSLQDEAVLQIFDILFFSKS